MSYREIRSAAARTTGLPLDITAAILDGARPYVALMRDQGGLSLHMPLSIHQLNVLIYELEETRDELVDQLEQDHKLRTARLAEPEDAAPGHERYETYSGVIGGGHACYVESRRGYVDMLYITGSKEGSEFLLLGEPGIEHDSLHVGDRIEFERLGNEFGRIVRVHAGDRPQGSAPIKWLDLHSAAQEAERTDPDLIEWRRDRDAQLDDAARGRLA